LVAALMVTEMAMVTLMQKQKYPPRVTVTG
jgi:hypothetical protein